VAPSTRFGAGRGGKEAHCLDESGSRIGENGARSNRTMISRGARPHRDENVAGGKERSVGSGADSALGHLAQSLACFVLEMKTENPGVGIGFGPDKKDGFTRESSGFLKNAYRVVEVDGWGPASFRYFAWRSVKA